MVTTKGPSPGLQSLGEAGLVRGLVSHRVACGDSSAGKMADILFPYPFLALEICSLWCAVPLPLLHAAGHGSMLGTE